MLMCLHLTQPATYGNDEQFIRTRFPFRHCSASCLAECARDRPLCAVGKAILVSPVLRQGFNNVTAYFPKDDWSVRSRPLCAFRPLMLMALVSPSLCRYSIYTGEHTISASAPQRSLLLQTPPDMIQVG